MTPEEHERQQQLDRQCRNFHSQATGTIDQWIEVLKDTLRLTDCNIEAVLWEAMMLRVLDELESTQDATPERARALWMAIGCHYWIQRGLIVAMEDET